MLFIRISAGFRTICWGLKLYTALLHKLFKNCIIYIHLLIIHGIRLGNLHITFEKKLKPYHWLIKSEIGIPKDYFDLNLSLFNENNIKPEATSSSHSIYKHTSNDINKLQLLSITATTDDNITQNKDMTKHTHTHTHTPHHTCVVVIVMLIEFITTYAISGYHHWRCVFGSRSWRDVLDTTLCDKVCEWLAAGWWFSPGTPFSFTNKTDRHDLTKILLKVALNTITPLIYKHISNDINTLNMFRVVHVL